MKSGDSDHIVLLVAAQAVLRAERRRHVDARAATSASRLWVRSRVTDAGWASKRHALAVKRLAKLRIGEQAINSEQGHISRLLDGSVAREASLVVEIGRPGAVCECPVAFRPVLVLDDRGQSKRRDAKFFGS